MTEVPSPKALRGWAALLMASTLAVFLPITRNGFVQLDDGMYVVTNPHVLQGLTLGGLRWAFTTGATGNWAPLTWLSHMLDVSLFGTQPAGHHLTSVLLHALTVGLVFLALARATGRVGVSACVTALFAVHPLRVESVAWAAERKDVLCTFFCAATLLAYVGYRHRPGAARYAGVLALFALALLSKAMAVTLPAVLLLTDAWPLGPGPEGWRRRVLEKLPLAAMGAGVAGITILTQRAVGAMQTVAQLPLSTRLAGVPQAYVKMLGLTLVPRGMYFPYLRAEQPGWLVALEAALLVLLLAVAFAQRRQRPSLLVGLAWFLGMMVPTVGLIQVGPQLTGDRFTYFPHVGLFAGVAFALPPLAGRARRLAVAGVVALWGCFAALSLAQERLWESSDRFFTHALAEAPDNDWMQVSLGLLRLSEHRPAEAKALLEGALARRSSDGFTWACLGSAWLELGRADRALAAARRGVELSPTDPDAQMVLGKSLLASGDAQGAIAALREAKRLAPDRMRVLHTLVNALGVAGRPAEALAEADAALALAPSDTELWTNRGVSLALLRRFPEAAASFERAAALDPENPAPRAMLENVRRDARSAPGQ